MANDPNFKRPKEFRPERYLQEDGKTLRKVSTFESSYQELQANKSCLRNWSSARFPSRSVSGSALEKVGRNLGLILNKNVKSQFTSFRHIYAFSSMKLLIPGIARVELFLGLISTFQNFKISPRPGETIDLEPKQGQILMPKPQKLRIQKV